VLLLVKSHYLVIMLFHIDNGTDTVHDWQHALFSMGDADAGPGSCSQLCCNFGQTLVDNV